MLVVTRHAKERGLPLRPKDLLTKRGGQVVGLGRAAAQAILKDHGIRRTLAEEGGRTSRGSIDHMRRYAAFLNELHRQRFADLDTIESWWIGRVREHFAARPLTLRLDPSKSLRSVVRDLVDQAAKRQREARGTAYAGAVLQHLVGAKLEILYPGSVQHHGSAVKDEAAGRPADYLIRQVAIHVTTSPSEALIRRSARNLQADLRPIIVTTRRGAAVAEALAEDAGIEGRLDIFEVEQFVATNIYERSGFAAERRRVSVEQLINTYNEIVQRHETDPSLRIEISA
jgi:Domain of unknown function (DUF4928)